MDFNNIVDEKELILVPTETRFHLEKMNSYTRGISVISFIAGGCLGILGLLLMFGGSFYAGMIPGLGSALGAGVFVFLGLFLIGMGAVLIFLNVKLYRFGTLTNSSVQKENSEELELGLKNLKTYFVGMGVCVIISVAMVFFSLIAFGGILMAMVSGGRGGF